MAWWFQTSLLDEDRPKVTVAPESIAAYNQARLALTAEYGQLPFSDPRFQAGQPVEMINGYDLPDLPPFQVSVKAPLAAVPDILSTGIGWMVSDKVSAEIEGVEPGRHKFHPAVITTEDQAGVDRWRFLNLRERADTVALGACVNVFKQIYRDDPGFYRYIGQYWHADTTVAVHKARIAGRAVWYDFRLNCRMISDALAGFIQRENIRGWSLTTFDRPNRVLEV